MTPISREEFLAHVTPIQTDISEVITLLKEQGKHATELDKRIAILEDRQPSRSAAQWGGLSGAGAALIVAILDYFFKIGH